MPRLAWICGVLLAASACGKGQTDVRTRSGLTLFTGTIAYFALGYDPGTDPPTASELVVEIHESPGGCFQSGVSRDTPAVLRIYLVAPEGTSVAPGRFEIVGPFDVGHASAYYDKYPRDVPAASGELELDRLSSEDAHGTVDVTLADDTRMQGEFLAAPCP